MKRAKPTPALTDDIRFERFERDTQYNRDRRAENELRYLIYDFRVLIDGDHRATLWRVGSGRGYELRDADGRPIPDRDNSHDHRGAEVDRQAGFFQFIQDRLRRIPSATGLAELRCADAILEIQIDHFTRETIVGYRKKEAAGAVFAALQRLTAEVRRNMKKRISRSDFDASLIAKAEQAESVLAAVVDEPMAEDMINSVRWDIRRNLREAVL